MSFSLPTSIHTATNNSSLPSSPSIPQLNKLPLDIAALPRKADYFGQGETDVAIYDINYSWFWPPIPSKQEVRLYSNLPLDIVRLIFDMTMRENPKPLHLLFVSQEVKSWIEPLIYEHIDLSDDRQRGLLYRTYSDWRKWQFRKGNSTERRNLPLRNIKSLIAYNYPPSMLPMFGAMTGLEQVACWHFSDPFIFHSYPPGKTSSTSATHEAQEDTYRYKNVRHLSLNGSSLYPSITFCHRAFRDITHLDMYFCQFLAWETLRQLQSLTHLALDMVENRPHYRFLTTEVLEPWVSRIITVCPPSVQVLLICCIETLNKNFDLIDFIRSGTESSAAGGGRETRIPSSVASDPKDYHKISLRNLQYFSQLTLGKIDPRIVVGSSVKLHDNHTFKNGVVYITYTEGQGDWYGHDVLRWNEAERIFKRREVSYG